MPRTLPGDSCTPSVGGTSQSYDSNANLTTGSFGYDIFNRVTSGSSSATLVYDPLGRLFETDSSSTSERRFLYDGANIIAEYSSGGALLRRYVHGPGVDEPLVWYEGTGTSDRRWLVGDRDGSIIAVTNASGVATNVNTYDEYGIPGSSNAGLFQYTGQAWLPELSAYHYKARVYSPSIGRFTQTDPLLYDDGMNTYAYVSNDPTNARDPSGQFEVCTKKREVGFTETEEGGFIIHWVYSDGTCWDLSPVVSALYSFVGIKLTLPDGRVYGGGNNDCGGSARSLFPDYVEVQGQAGNVRVPGLPHAPLSGGGQTTIDRYGRVYGGTVATSSRTPLSGSANLGYIVAGPGFIGTTPTPAQTERFLSGGATQIQYGAAGRAGGVTVNQNGVAANGGLATPGPSVSGSLNSNRPSAPLGDVTGCLNQ